MNNPLVGWDDGVRGRGIRPGAAACLDPLRHRGGVTSPERSRSGRSKRLRRQPRAYPSHPYPAPHSRSEARFRPCSAPGDHADRAALGGAGSFAHQHGGSRRGLLQTTGGDTPNSGCYSRPMYEPNLDDTFEKHGEFLVMRGSNDDLNLLLQMIERHNPNGWRTAESHDRSRYYKSPQFSGHTIVISFIRGGCFISNILGAADMPVHEWNAIMHGFRRSAEPHACGVSFDLVSFKQMLAYRSKIIY